MRNVQNTRSWPEDLTVFSFIIGLSLMASSGPGAFAASTEDGIRLYQKIAGVPPVGAQLESVSALAAANKLWEIGELATEHRSFLTSTVKGFASPMTNVTQQSAVDLNDFSATVIGAIRDDLPMSRLLYDDILYEGDTAALSALGVSVAAYSRTTNNHYRDLDRRGVDLSSSALFKRVKQTDRTDALEDAQGNLQTMGVMTTRAAGEAFFNAGTNRRVIRFMLVNFMCLDMEQMHDTTQDEDRIRWDVPRNAGGDSSTFINSCSGCHAGMDPLAGAFAYYDFNGVRVGTDQNGDYIFEGALIRSPSVVAKMKRDPEGNDPGSSIPPDAEGHITVNDSWENRWTKGLNSFLGFRNNLEGETIELERGAGPHTLGKVFAATEQFSKCMAQRAYRKVCAKTGDLNDADELIIKRITENFEKNGQKGKALFIDSAIACLESERK